MNAEIAAIEAAGGRLRRELPLRARRVRHDVDRAADGVTAEERALRALQDLDAIHVEQVLVRADGAREIHAVEIHADAGVEVEREVVLADAADRGGEHRAVARERRAGVEIHVGREVAERVDVA